MKIVKKSDLGVDFFPKMWYNRSMKKKLLLLSCASVLFTYTSAHADELTDKRTQLETVKTEQVQKQNELDKIKVQITELNAKKDSASKTTSQVSDIIKFLENQKEQQENDVKTLKKKLANVSKKVTDVTSNYNLINTSLEQSEKDVLEVKVTDAENKVSEIKTQIIKAQSLTENPLEKTFNDMNAKARTLEQELKEKQATIDDLNVQIQELETKPKPKPEQAQAVETSPTVSFGSAEDQDLFNKVKDRYDASDTGLSTHTRQIKHFLKAKFGVDVVGGVRGDDDGTGHGHSSGLAVDFMVDTATGDQLSAYIANNFNDLGVYYQIWKQRYFSITQSIYGGAGTWGYMPDRGGITANHYDHVHVSFAY